MTFDILIVTRKPPTRAMVESFLRETGWRVSLEGDLAADAGNVIGTSKSLLRRPRPIFVLSGPYPAENEDLPAPVQRVIQGRAFISEMNLPWSVTATKDAARCIALCEDLAIACDGAVYDPQDDALVFPDLPERRVRREPKLTAVRQLTLEWYLADSRREEAHKFLDLVNEIWPEARPTRFGPHEPFGHKLSDPDGVTAFADLWHEDWLFSWKAKQPVFGGAMGRSPNRDEPPGHRHKVHLTVNANATVIADDMSACDRAVDLFARVADELGAFFGAGYVTRGVLAGSRGALWYGQETENFSFDWIDGPWWTGLPAKGTWLSWFGEPYRGVVAAALGDRALERNRGLLVRLGPAPMDSDEVRGLAPRLPADLVVEMTPRYGEVAMKGTGKPMLLGYDRSPAKVIPPLA